jgi:molybdenum cofactor guanylyltransferase
MTDRRFDKSSAADIRLGGIVVCGGLSSRMGRPKAWLPFGDELLLPRVVRLLGAAVSPIVVVAAQDQDLPRLPAAVEIVRDQHHACGPLAGVAAGLHALTGRCEAAFTMACDVPFLVPEFVLKMGALLGDFDAVVPRAGEFWYPLASVYRISLAQNAFRMIGQGQLKLAGLVSGVRCQFVDPADFRDVDPELRSLGNLNSPEEYARALAER